MKNSFYVFLLILLTSLNVKGQFSNEDIVVTTKGLSEKNSLRFKSSKNIQVLVSALNQLMVPKSIAPIEINVTYNNNSGEIIFEIPFNSKTLYYKNSDDDILTQQWTKYGNNGVGLFTINKIMTAIGQYKKEVAKNENGFSSEKEIIEFTNGLKLKKKNSDWLLFQGHNSFDSRGFFKSFFYTNAILNLNNKVFEINSTNSKLLNDYHFFEVGNSEGLDGKKNSSFLFLKFFEVKEEIESLEFENLNNNNNEQNKTIESIDNSFPFIIDKSTYDNIIIEDSEIPRIKEINKINKLLTPTLRQKLISVNKNKDILSDYSFVKIGDRKFKGFILELFAYLYEGEGIQMTVVLNVKESVSNKIIEQKEIAEYIETDFKFRFTNIEVTKNGKIKLNTFKDTKNPPTTKFVQINENGRIVNSK
jgi:hypothetical protein